MKRILFQGDSITDCDRSRDENEARPFLGKGYPHLIYASLGADCPGEYACFNRGISGNRIVDLYARIKKDFINLRPDYASILIGVNDVWHEYAWQNGVDTAKFEKIYGMYLDEIRQALPEAKLLLLSPFVLEGFNTENTAEHPHRLEFFRDGVAEKADVVKKLAKSYRLPLIELQPVFDRACEQAPASNWLRDGVHPTEAGHELIKRLWLAAFDSMK